MKKKWYQKNSVIVFLLVFFFPVGLFLMWKHARWNIIAKLIITGIFAGLILLTAFSDTSKPVTVSNKQESATTSDSVQPTTAPTTTPITEEQVNQQPTQNPELPTPSPVQKELKYAVLSGADPDTGELIVEDINIWEKAGSGGRENMSVGKVPHNTKVEVLGEKKIDGVVFYQIRSSVGKVSVLPTDFEAKRKAMEKRPQSEWSVPADETFPVEGWVTDSFITDLQ